VKPYADLAGIIVAATKAYVDDVQSGRFPQPVTPASTTPVA
jgi:ketopantoate hydroxymethyltransferase